MIDSVLRIGKKSYPQVFLEESSYDVKEKNITRCITENIKISFSSNVNYNDNDFEEDFTVDSE